MVIEEGETVPMEKMGKTEKVRAFVLFPVSITVMAALPPVTRSEVGIVAVKSCASTKVVARAVPLKLTTEFTVKPVPVTLRETGGALEGATGLTGKMDERWKAGRPPTGKSKTPRPCVAARRVREPSRKASDSTTTLGRPVAGTAQVVPTPRLALEVAKTPTSVPM